MSENIDAVAVPSGMVPLLAEVKDQRLRETLRDFASSQGFRRDIYRRGVGGMAPAEHHVMLQDLTVAWTGLVAGEQVTIATPIGQLTGRPEIYKPLLAMLEAGPLTVRRAHSLEPFAGRSLLELLQAITLLIAGGFAHPVLPGGDSAGAREGARRLNVAIAAINASGGDIPRLALPVIGSAANVDLLETLAIGELLSDRPHDIESLTNSVQASLARGGRSVQRDGKAVANQAEARTIVAEALRVMQERRIPVLRSLGVID